MVDSTELEYGVTTTTMAKDLPRLKILASFFIVQEQVEYVYIGAINKGRYAQDMTICVKGSRSERKLPKRCIIHSC